MNKNRLKTLLIILPLLASLPALAQFDNAFQSTSTMPGSGSAYASDPSITSTGQATYGDVAPNRGRTVTGTPGGDDAERQTPVGSAVPALLLLAGGYAAVVAYRRRRQA